MFNKKWDQLTNEEKLAFTKSLCTPAGVEVMKAYGKSIQDKQDKPFYTTCCVLTGLALISNPVCAIPFGIMAGGLYLFRKLS